MTTFGCIVCSCPLYSSLVHLALITIDADFVVEFDYLEELHPIDSQVMAIFKLYDATTFPAP